MSKYFIFLGLITPLLILSEIVILKHALPVGVSLLLGLITLLLWVFRALGIKSLGKNYSVDIKVDKETQLIRTGVFKYLRHPIYLVGILENFFYPMACGAYLSMFVLLFLGTPAILWRRSQEEKALLARFREEYERYQKYTYF